MDETITENEELTKTFNSFFSSMVDNSKIEHDIDRQATFQLIQTLSCGR